MGEGGELGQSYIILGGDGLQNYYITLYGEKGCQKIDIFLLYNMWTAPIGDA